MFNLLLAVLLLALLLCSTSAQTVFRTSYFISRNRSVRGRDIDCKGRNEQGKLVDYCRECGGIATVAAKCNAMPDCNGFDMENADCGYLKRRALPGDQEVRVDYTSFCKGGWSTADTNGCAGDYQMWLDYDTPSGVFDFNCQYKDGGIEKPFCKVKGNHLALMNECDKWAECGAITINMESNGQDGWLKRAIRTNVGASNTFRRGWLYLLKTK